MFSWLRRARAGLVGLDNSGNEIRLVHVKNHQMIHKAWCSLSTENNEANLISQLVSKTNTRGVPAAIALSHHQVIEKQVQFPKEFSAADIHHEIKTHYLPGNPEDFYFDFFIVREKDAAHQAVTLWITEKAKVDRYKHTVEIAGLKVVCVDVDSYAEKRALKHFQHDLDMSRYLISYGLTIRREHARD